MKKNTSTDFEQIAEKLISRRDFLKTGIGFGLGSFVIGATGMNLTACSDNTSTSKFAFTAVAANGEDTVTVPNEYDWQIVASWGDPLWSQGEDFDEASRGTGATQELAFGDNNDGMSLFQDGERYVLAVNNEYVNRSIIHGNRDTLSAETADDVRKSKAAHGVSVFEITNDAGNWSMVKDSPVNRRITADTPMEITGPACGHELMKTAADKEGHLALGTFNNCGNGRTPWGSYLSCEENFNGYFASSDASAITDEMNRYGIKAKGRGYHWEQFDERFDVAKHPNEANRFGYIVEIDPLNPEATPKKRTALGRFKHENAEVVLSKNNRVVVYMGDDERGEFLYKYISHAPYVAGESTDELLNQGDLFAARFNEDGSGEWLALTPQTTGMSNMAEICIHTRQAASAAGATTMDRPEWVAAHPDKVEAYCCLTNNKNRGKKPNAGGDATPVGGPNPRAANHYGQIVRWRSDDHSDTNFAWDLFVVAGNPTVHNDAYAGSSNINAGNLFNSPDGLAFDPNGMLWIQTDGNYSNQDDFANMGNNQMLVGDPDSGEIRRFMVGPRECEVTGFCWTADQTTLFIGIQHPGEKGGSHFPTGGDSVPRSSVIAITRKDGGIIA